MTCPLVMVGGPHGSARAALVRRLLEAHPGSSAVHHDLGQTGRGRVVRTVRTADGVTGRTEIELAHGCAPCTLRNDLVPELLRRAAAGASLLVVDLWDSVEPRVVAEAVSRDPDAAEALRLTEVLVALDPGRFPADLRTPARLADLGKQAQDGDERYLPEVLSRQIEYATGLVVVPPAEPSGSAALDEELTLDLLSQLVPVTPVIASGGVLPEVAGPRLDVDALAARVDAATALLPCDAQTGDLQTVVWRRLRPLHPQRLFDAVDELVTSSVRSRGRFWLATRHNRMIAWDAVAGVISVEDTGPWLAALPDTAWELQTPARRAAAALDWSPVVGDRVQHLVFTGFHLDRDHIHALLDSCLLTEEEILAGSDGWARYADPFSAVLDLSRTAA